jgi:hypothetical protein
MKARHWDVDNRLCSIVEYEARGTPFAQKWEARTMNERVVRLSHVLSDVPYILDPRRGIWPGFLWRPPDIYRYSTFYQLPGMNRRDDHTL